jgi:hypothetical protein
MEHSRVLEGRLLAVPAEAYRAGKPFPHVVQDDFLDRNTVERINKEWPADWHKESGRHNKKWSGATLPDSARYVIDALSTPKACEAIGSIVGIKGLIPDPNLFGGGLHCIPPGGFLKMHVDFNRHPNGWHRRVNLLVYLNLRWQDEWGGHLELGAREKKIAPIGGRLVIFETNDNTWHGHPDPLTCPEDIQRRSLALYYYTPDAPKEQAHTTIYMA